MNNYVNYHKHTCYSNVITPDSAVQNKDYLNRTLELGHTVLSSVEHGWTGNFMQVFDLAKENNLKFLFGLETYFVKDRFEKDATNAHLIVLAKNENGRKSINNMVSEASITGFYYKPRVDLSLLFSLPKNDVWLTSACVGGVWKYSDDYEDLILQFFEYFGNNYFLETQYHNTDSQKAINARILNLSNKHGIPIISGCDSHYISSKQSKDREDYLLSKGIVYEDEVGWNMDYPDGQAVYNRYVEQDILNKHQIKESMGNTLIFNDVEEYNSIIFNKEIKMPTIYPDKTQEEKDNILKTIVWTSFEKEKSSIPEEKHDLYVEEINKELDIIIITKHSDYFLLNYEIIKTAKEMGGIITPSGRGSAVGFYTNKLLGFTQVDRISSPVKMYPERFMSATRILESKSLADFDMNLANPEIFALAQKKVLGEQSSYPMIAFGTLRPKAAWKMYARAKNVPFDLANIVSSQIDKYEIELKHTSEYEKDSVNILDYITTEYQDIFKESEKYLGIVSDIKIAPCGYLLLNEDIRTEIGLIRIKSQNGAEHICCVIDGLSAETHKFLKNDLLKVSVVELINRVYKRIGQEIDSVNGLLEICKNNDKIWNVFKNAWTMGINQVEQKGTNGRVAKYAPTNISELCAFVAAIRPGFKSMYKIFENRENFSYGIPSFDNLLRTPELPQSFLLYQEMAMAALNFAGIPLSECYDIIKNISKKRVDKVLGYKEIFINGFSDIIQKNEYKTERESLELAQNIWQILENSSRYFFNSAHAYSVAIDGLYGAYLKSHYPLYFYEQFLQQLESNGEKDRIAQTKIEAEKAYKIKFLPYRFGQDNRNIFVDEKLFGITSSLSSIKGFNTAIGENMFILGQNQYENFVEFLIDAEEKNMFTSKIEELIKINYFEIFGNNQKLHEFYLEFTKGTYRYSRSHNEKTKEKRKIELLKIFENLPNKKFPILMQILSEQEVLGNIQSMYPTLDKKYVYVLELNEKFSPRVQAYCLSNGSQSTLKIQKKTFDNNNFLVGDILYCNSFKKKQSVKFENGKYENIEDEWTWWIDSYKVISPEEFDKMINTKYKGENN